MGNHYNELSLESREQVDATIYLLNQDFWPLDAKGEALLRDRLSNLVLSCLAHDGNTRTAFEKLLSLAGEVPYEGEIIDFVASTPAGRHLLEKRIAGE